MSEHTTRADLEKYFADAKKKVDLNCDEYHGHSALRGCVSGPKEALRICELHEYIERLERVIREAGEKLNEKLLVPTPEEA